MRGKIAPWEKKASKRIYKNGQVSEYFLETISVSYQNQNFLSKCTTNYKNFRAEVKTGSQKPNQVLGTRQK